MHLKSIYNIKNIIITLLLLAICFEVKSQNLPDFSSRKPDFDRGMSIYLVLPSFMFSAPGNINALLVENGYPHIPRGNLNYGLGINYRIKKFEPGLDFAVGNQMVTNRLSNSELLKRPITANIYLNYHLARYKSYTFYTLIGYSITDTNLIISKQSTTDDFSSLLQNPNTSVNLQHLSDGFLVGFGVAFAEHWMETPGTYRLKFAYRIPSGSYPWESRFSNFGNSPLDSFPYFFIQFEIGTLANWKKGNNWMDKL